VVASHGWGAGRPRRKAGEWGEGPSLTITAMFCLEFAHVFWLSVLMRKVASEHPFCVLINMNSYISHLFSLIYFLVKQISNILFYMIDVIIGRHTWNCQVRTHMYTKIQAHTHTHTHKK